MSRPTHFPRRLRAIGITALAVGAIASAPAWADPGTDDSSTGSDTPASQSTGSDSPSSTSSSDDGRNTASGNRHTGDAPLSGPGGGTGGGPGGSGGPGGGAGTLSDILHWFLGGNGGGSTTPTTPGGSTGPTSSADSPSSTGSMGPTSSTGSGGAPIGSIGVRTGNPLPETTGAMNDGESATAGDPETPAAAAAAAVAPAPAAPVVAAPIVIPPVVAAGPALPAPAPAPKPAAPKPGAPKPAAAAAPAPSNSDRTPEEQSSENSTVFAAAYTSAQRVAPVAAETARQLSPAMIAILGGIALLGSGSFADALRRAHLRQAQA